VLKKYEVLYPVIPPQLAEECNYLKFEQVNRGKNWKTLAESHQFFSGRIDNLEHIDSYFR